MVLEPLSPGMLLSSQRPNASPTRTPQKHRKTLCQRKVSLLPDHLQVIRGNYQINYTLLVLQNLSILWNTNVQNLLYAVMLPEIRTVSLEIPLYYVIM